MEKLTAIGPRNTLPAQVFRNRLTWASQQVLHHFIPVFTTLLGIVSLIILINLSDFLSVLPATCYIGLITFVVCVSLYFPPIWFFRKRCNVLSNTKELFSSLFPIIDVGLDATEWEELAGKVNKVLCEQDYWRTPHFFSTGKDVRLPSGNTFWVHPPQM